MIQKAPAVVVDNEDLLICARMDAIEDGPGYLPPLAQRVPSSPRSTDAIPPPGLGPELYVPATPGSISTSATSRPSLFVPHHADMKLLPVSVLKLRLLLLSPVDIVAGSNET